MIGLTIAILGSYLLGSVSLSFFIGKYIFKSDLRKLGSGNLGATNVLRNYGIISACLVLTADFLKGIIACLFLSLLIPVVFLEPKLAMILCGAMTVLGHMFPFYLHWKGGKGVATGAAVAISIAPLCAIPCMLIFSLLVISTRFVFLASIASAIVLPIAYYFLYKNADFSLTVLLFFSLVTLVIIFSHRKNIYKFVKGEEKPFHFIKAKK